MKIGLIIKEVLEKKGMKIGDFAEQLNTVRQNVYKIFQRESIDTELLMQICQILDYDFFQYYNPSISQILPKTNNNGHLSTEIQNQILQEKLLHTENLLSQAHKEIEYLKKIIELMEDRVELMLLKQEGEKY